MARPILPDALWAVVEPVLPAAGRLAGRRHLDPAARRPARAARQRRQTRLAAGVYRFVQCAGSVWGAKTGPNPTDRAKAGTKHHLMVDASGVPLAATVSAANAAVHQNRRLKVRYERRDNIHQAFLTLACVKVCWYRLAGRFR